MIPSVPRAPAAAAALVLAAALAAAPSVPAPAAAGGDPAMPPMATYVLGLLRKGPAWAPGRSAHLDSLQAGHLANMKRMWEAGSLVAAGPVSAKDDLRGIWVFRADSVAEVRGLAAGDPSVREGRLRVEWATWWAPAGIGDGYRERLGRPGVTADSMVTRWLVMLERGPRHDAPADAELPRGHVAHILARIAEGSSPAAGPVDGGGALAGISIYSTDSLAAWNAANADPAVQAGRLRVTMVPLWFAYGNLPGER